MSSVRLLHLADLHLDAPLGGFGRLAERRRARVLEAFRALPELAAAESAQAVLIAGDLFDGPRPADSAVAAVRETVRRLLEAEIPVFAVPGNHDAASLNPTLYEEALGEAAVFTEASFGDPVTVGLGETELHVYGIAHDPAERPEPLATFERSSRAGLHVALLHGAVPGAPHWEGGHALRLPIEELSRLEVDYIALGDYHRFRPPEEFESATGPIPACYPGSFAAVDLSETGPKGVAVVELSGSEAPRVRLVSAGVPEVVRLDDFDVTPYASETEVADALGDRVPEGVVPLVRLTGEPAFPLDPEPVRIRLEERFGHAAVEDDTRFFDSDRLADLAREKTIAGHVARLGLLRIEETADPEARRTAERGLRVALRAMEVR